MVTSFGLYSRHHLTMHRLELKNNHAVIVIWKREVNVVYSNTILFLIVCLYMTTLTEVFPCFFLNCKANARVKPAKTGHGPHSS